MRACTSAIITSAISTSYIITSAIYFCMILLGGNQKWLSPVIFYWWFTLFCRESDFDVIYAFLVIIFWGQICIYAIQIAFASLL